MKRSKPTDPKPQLITTDNGTFVVDEGVRRPVTGIVVLKGHEIIFTADRTYADGGLKLKRVKV